MSRSAPFTVVSIGDFVTDIVVSIPALPACAGAHQVAHALRLEPGGAGNFVTAGARLGLQMVVLGAMGPDPFGAAAAEALAREGADLRGLIRQPDGTTTTVISLVDDAGKHVFLGTYGTGPTVQMPALWQDQIRQADAVFASGYTLHEERLAEALLDALRFARTCRVPVFFDPGPQMADVTAAQRVAVLGLADILLMTEEEIPLMTGGAGGLEAAHGLLEAGVRLICIKRGPQGCLLMSAAGQVEHPGFPVTARDTAAAGDSFAAAFIDAFLRGWTLDEIAAFANAMGAAKVQKLGSGTQVPTRQEIQAILTAAGLHFDF